MREVRKRFCKSEMALMAWRSSEMAHNMRTRMQNTVTERDNGSQPVLSGAEQALEERLGGDVVHNMVDDAGEISLRRLTGPQALRYCRALGIPLATGGMSRTLAQKDDVTQQYEAMEQERRRLNG